ncbi:tetratricopeptide repeat protein [Streptomyces sp. NPDC001920]
MQGAKGMALWRWWRRRPVVHTGGDTANVFSGGSVRMLVQGRDIALHLPRDVPSAMRGMPPAPSAFTGRTDELTELAAFLAPRPDGESPETVAVHVVTGMAGIGKTALVLHTAHAALKAGSFTGGAVFLDLYGYDPDRRLQADNGAMELLGALGVPGEVIPAGAQARGALVRTVLAELADAGHRVLIVLDNAAASDQVAPLLPGDGGHRVLVTSRHILTALGVPGMEVEVLPPKAAHALLAAALQAARPGDSRLRRSTSASRALVEACGGLPLALRITAGRLAATPDLTVGALAADLANAAQRLEMLSDGERPVRAAFDLSYTHLRTVEGEAAARAFRLLTACPWPEFTTNAAAALIGQDRATTAQMLGTVLARAHLIQQAGPDRWRMHDLIRLYATMLIADHPDDPADGMEELLTYYVDTAAAADQGLSAPEGQPGPEVFPTPQHAWAWFDTERATLLSALDLMAADNRHTAALTLALALNTYLHGRRDFLHAVHAAEVACTAARTLSDRHSEGRAWHNLGMALVEGRRFEEATDAYEHARDLARATGNRHGEAAAWHSLGMALADMRRFEEAIDAGEYARVLLQETGDRHGEAAAWHSLGMALADMRRFGEAIDAGERACSLFQETGDRHGEAAAWNSLGMALSGEWRFGEAIDAYERACSLFQETGDRHGLGTTWLNLCMALTNVRRFGEAMDAGERACSLFQETGDRHGEADAWNSLGNALSKVRRFVEAIDAYERACSLFQETGDRHSEAQAWNNLGLTLRGVRRFEKAITACQRACTLLQETGDRYGEATAWNSLGSALSDVRRFGEAIDSYEHARDLAQETGDRHSEATAWHNLGNALVQVRRFEEAIDAYERACSLFQETGDRHSEAHAWNNLGMALADMRRFEEAIGAGEHARNLAHETGDRDLELLIIRHLRSVLQQIEAVQASEDRKVPKTQTPPDMGASSFNGSLSLLFPPPTGPLEQQPGDQRK